MLNKFFLTVAAVIAMTGSAFAADLPNTKAPPPFVPPPPPIFTWTGVYIGGQIGYQWGNDAATLLGTPLNAILLIPTPQSVTYGASGVVGGAHIGYNYQFNQFVVGIEGEVDGSSYNGSVLTGFGLIGTRENVEGSVRGRVGFAWERALVYATGGAAFAGIDNIYGPITISHTRVGWTVGGGVEYAIDNNWSIGAEYRYTDYGHYTDFPLGPVFPISHHETDNRVQARFNYRFELAPPPVPVVAKY